MSSIKEYWFDLQEQEKIDWIREHLDDEDADEETDGWDELSTEYDLFQESLREKAEFEAEMEWYDVHSYSEMHDIFLSEICSLEAILQTEILPGHESATYKMIYAHSVTLFESFLGDTIKSLVKSNDSLFENALAKVEELKKAKFSLKEISSQKDGAVGLAIQELSSVMYHNIPKVKRIYESVLGTKLEIDISELDEITATRHDIVHRNGKTKSGEVVELDKSIVEKAISDIKVFVLELQVKINEQTKA